MTITRSKCARTYATKLGIRNLVNKLYVLDAKATRMVYAQAALAKQGKMPDVIIRHFLATAATRGNPNDCNYSVTEIDDYPKHFSLLIFAHRLKRYTENFRKLASVLLIWQLFRSPLLSIKTQLSMSSHACHSRGAQHSLACCNLLVLYYIITHLAGQTYVWHGCKWNFAGPQIYLQPAKIKSQHFGVSLKFLVCN